MKKNLTRIVITLIFVLVSIIYIFPTYKDYSLNKELSTLTGNDSIDFVTKYAEKIRDARDGRIKLGLDLKGGMYVVLDVDVVKLLEDVAKQKDDPTFMKILEDLKIISETSDENILTIFKQKLAEKGLTLKNFYGEITDDEAAIEKKLQDAIDNSIDRAISVVRNRVDRYGVAEPQIQKIGGKRIIVELPGVSNPDDVRKLLQGTAQLTFQLLKEGDAESKILNDINKTLAKLRDSTGANISSSNLLMTDESKTKETITKVDTTKKKTDSKESAGKEQKKDVKKEADKTKKDTSKTKKDTLKTKKDTLKTKKDTTNLTDTSSENDTTKAASNPFFELFDPELSQSAGGPVASMLNKEKIERILKMDAIKAILPSDI